MDRGHNTDGVAAPQSVHSAGQHGEGAVHKRHGTDRGRMPAEEGEDVRDVTDGREGMMRHCNRSEGLQREEGVGIGCEGVHRPLLALPLGVMGEDMSMLVVVLVDVGRVGDGQDVMYVVGGQHVIVLLSAVTGSVHQREWYQ